MDINDDDLVNLIARCALNDQLAMKTLFYQTSPYLLGIAYRILQSKDASNDVLQEAFIQIWNNASSYQAHLSKPLTWMGSIVRYRSLDRLEKEKRTSAPLVEENTEALIQSIATDKTPEKDALNRQLRGHIQDCLENLNESTRQCIKLAYLYGYSREEIADKLTSNINTVKSWLKRGAERLKRCLEHKLEAQT